MPRCPVCDADVDLDKTPTVPFCSDRCRLIDLGRWLDESYAVPEPKRPADDADDEEAD
ncbi:MAG: DNA gyrase inhibitor YacG [Planctomycetia bacterium]|nr:DNA gyrase inhibitor YacG [Planctomycetia bacterium]